MLRRDQRSFNYIFGCSFQMQQNMNSPLQQKSCIIPCSCYTAHSNGSPKNLFYFDVTTNHMTNHSNAYVLAKNQHNKRTKPKLDDNFYT
mmetsp:Transcript_25962/g.54702  ORF Transcript_25962/g.54702 Transcript_25962/m.54702 type:complete len:89 (-) Transcript_25962:816-1082(-)